MFSEVQLESRIPVSDKYHRITHASNCANVSETGGII